MTTAREQARQIALDAYGENGWAGAETASDIWEPLVAYWKDRCERAEESLRLHVDEGIAAW